MNGRILITAGAFLKRRALATLPTAKGNWKRGMKQEAWLLYPGMAIILLWLVIPQAFQLGILTGLGFLSASASAIYFGYIFRNPGAIIIVYVGVIFGGEVMSLLGVAKDDAFAGDLLPAAVLVVLTVYLWIWAERMKKIDFEWEPPIVNRLRQSNRKPRRSRRRK